MPTNDKKRPLYETDGSAYGKITSINGTKLLEGTIATLTPAATERSPDCSKLWTVDAAYGFASAIQGLVVKR